eukprot:3795388-Prymnesium_polylepis.1
MGLERAKQEAATARAQLDQARASHADELATRDEEAADARALIGKEHAWQLGELKGAMEAM